MFVVFVQSCAPALACLSLRYVRQCACSYDIYMCFFKVCFQVLTLLSDKNTLETQWNLMSTGSKVGTFVDRFETCVPLSRGRHARNLIPYVDTFQPYAGRQVDTLETETSQRGARSFVQISLSIYLLDSIVRQ